MKEKTIFKSEEGKNLILAEYDEILSVSEMTYIERYIQTTFGRTHIIESGEKNSESILLFHGSSSNSLMWLTDIEELSQSFHVFAIDILGEPGKSEARRLNLKNDDFPNWIIELMTQLKIKKTVLVGNSLGGWISLKFATTFPEKVSKLVLIATSGITPVRPSFMLKILFLSITGKTGKNYLNKLICGKKKVPKVVSDFTNLVMENFNPILEPLPIISDDALCKLTMPVMYIAGENDIMLNALKTENRLKENCPNLKSVVLNDTGHVVFDIMDLVIPFLN